MIELYSQNVSEGENEAIEWNTATLKKGNTVESDGTEIQFNKCGIYELSCNAVAVVPSAQSSSPQDISIQLEKDGVRQPQAVSTATAGGETSKYLLSFTTLIQVARNDTCNPCTSPIRCRIVNTGAPITLQSANVVVTKIV